MWAAPPQWGLLNPPRRPALPPSATRGRLRLDEPAASHQLPEEEEEEEDEGSLWVCM